MKQNLVSFSRKVVLFFRRPGVEKSLKILAGVVKNLFFIFVILLLYIPIIIIAFQSINTSSQITDFAGVTWKYWLQILTWDIPSASIRNSILTTLIVAGASTLISTVFGTFFAVGIHSLAKKKRQGMVLLNQVPILNADIITGLSMWMVFKFISTLIPIEFGLGTLITSHVFFCIPYVVLSVLPKLNELDDNLYDAALDLGCKPMMGIVKVIVPAIGSGILSGMMIAFTMSIDDYLISFFNDGSSGIGGQNLSVYVYGASNLGIDRAVYAFSTILSLVIFVALLAVYVRSALKKRRAEHWVSKIQKI